MKNKGFTLIELVVVIVILGILAATALPKFIDLTSDARKSVMQGLHGSIKSAVSMAHQKAILTNQLGGTGEIKVGDLYYAMRWGYPDFVARGDGSASGKGLAIDSLIELDNETDIVFNANFSPAVFENTSAAVQEKCRVEYFRAQDSDTPARIETSLTDC